MQIEDEAIDLHLHIPTQEKKLKQMLSDLFTRLTPAADALVTVFQQACYKTARNPFTLAADAQNVVNVLSEAFLGPAFLTQHLFTCLGSIKDGLLPTNNGVKGPAPSSNELAALLEALDKVHQLVSAHAQAQDTASCLSLFTEDAILDNFLEVVVDKLSAVLVSRRGGLRQHMDFLNSLARLLCVHLMKSLLLLQHADFVR